MAAVGKVEQLFCEKYQKHVLNKKMDNICRICLHEFNIMSSIFKRSDGEHEGFEDLLSLADKISSIAQVQLEESDGLPQSICSSCRLQVDKFHDFRVLVEVSDRTLRSYLESEKEKVNLKTRADTVEYKKFTTENLADEDLNLDGVNTIIVPTVEGMEVWKICDVHKEELEEETYENNVLSDFEPFEETSQMGMETNVMNPEMCLGEASERKTKVQRCQKCIRCNEFFRDGKELSIHLHAHAVEDEENNLGTDINCQLCFEPFSSLNALKIHIQDHFFDSKAISSELIKPNIEEQEQVNEKYYCSQCKEEFLTADQCSEHVKQHSEIKKFRCGICSRLFSRNSSRKRHELKHAEKRFVCPECGKFFKKRTELRYHISCHVDTPPTCDFCHKQFQNAQSLKLHRKRHTGESAYVCKTCGKNYYSNSELNRHIQIHLGRRDYPCSLCNQSFFSKPELTRHSKYHRGDKKFKCSLCPKSYFESGHLKIHLRVHTGERPFTCDICAKAFISKSKLIRHQKIHFKNRAKKNKTVEISKSF